MTSFRLRHKEVPGPRRAALCRGAKARYSRGHEQRRFPRAPAPPNPSGRLEPGPDLYFTLMRRLAGDLKGCLSPPA